MKKTKTKLHKRDYYYIIGTVGAIAAIAAVLALTATPEEASGVIAHGERVAFHKHAIMEYYIDGVKQNVPANIGVPLADSHPLARYGPAGIAPLHTHDGTGLVHIESREQRDYSFGDFLDLWDLDLSGKNATLFVNNQPVSEMKSYLIQDQDVLRLEVMAITS
jgi:hypothetical protein